MQRAIGALQCWFVLALSGHNRSDPHTGIRHAGTGADRPGQSAFVPLCSGTNLYNPAHRDITLVEGRDLGVDVGKGMERRTGSLSGINSRPCLSQGPLLMNQCPDIDGSGGSPIGPKIPEARWSQT